MNLLEVNALGISFGGLKAVDNFHVSVKKNELYGLIGPNGAGKTTIFNLLTGVYKPNAGEILLNGKNLVGMSCIKINHEGVARTFQNIRLFNKLSVLDNVKAGYFESQKYSFLDGIFRLPNYFKKEKAMDDLAMDLLSVFHLEDLAKESAGNLPYGKQRKLEPAAGMNPNETEELMETIRLVRDRFDMTVLLIEHDMKLVSGICDRLTVLNFGQVLAEGETAEVLHDEKVIKAYLGE